MPRPKKVVTEDTVVTPRATSEATPYYNELPATIVRTHEDGHMDITVSYDGKTQVQKNRVSPESIEYKNAP